MMFFVFVRFLRSKGLKSTGVEPKPEGLVL